MSGLLRLRDPLSQVFKINLILSLSLCLSVYVYMCVCVYIYVFCVLFPLVIPLQNPNVPVQPSTLGKEAWRAAVRGVTKVVQDLPTEQQCASIWQMFRLC